jgi:hypothetical protein
MPVVREKASKPGKERKVTDALNTTAALRTTTKKVGSLRCKVKGLSKLSKGGASKAITSPSPRQHVHCLHFGYRRERIMSGVCFKFNTCVLYQKTNIKKKTHNHLQRRPCAISRGSFSRISPPIFALPFPDSFRACSCSSQPFLTDGQPTIRTIHWQVRVSVTESSGGTPLTLRC